MELNLRTSTPEDEPFLMRVFASTCAERLAQGQFAIDEWANLITQQFHSQHNGYRSNFPDSTFEIVMAGDDAIGRLYLDRRPDEIRILDLTLLPEFRNQGTGTRLVKDLMSEAKARGQNVGAHIEHGSRAFGLAHRLGFAPRMETEMTTLMVWEPPGVVG